MVRVPCLCTAILLGLGGCSGASEPAGIPEPGTLAPARLPGWARHAAAASCAGLFHSGERIDVYGVFDGPGEIEPGGRLESDLDGGLFRASYTRAGELVELSNLASTAGQAPLQVQSLGRFDDGSVALLASVRAEHAADRVFGPGQVRFGTAGTRVDIAVDPDRSQLLVVRIEASGVVRFVLDLSAWTGVNISQLAALDDGSLALSGVRFGAFTVASITLPAPPEPMTWIARIDAGGDLLWATDATSAWNGLYRTVLHAAGASLLVSGPPGVTRLDFTGQSDGSWSIPNMELDALDLDSSGGLLALGRITGGALAVSHHGAAGGTAVVTHRVLDPFGEAGLLRAAGAGGFLVAGGYLGRQQIGEGSTVVTAPFVEGRASYVARFAADGTLSWLNLGTPIGSGPPNDYATGLDVSGDGAVLVCGSNRTQVRLGESDWSQDLPGPGVYIARLAGP